MSKPCDGDDDVIIYSNEQEHLVDNTTQVIDLIDLSSQPTINNVTGGGTTKCPWSTKCHFSV